jgi:hypothetical protein
MQMGTIVRRDWGSSAVNLIKAVNVDDHLHAVKRAFDKIREWLSLEGYSSLAGATDACREDRLAVMRLLTQVQSALGKGHYGQACKLAGDATFATRKLLQKVRSQIPHDEQEIRELLEVLETESLCEEFVSG